jgi:putative membrane-bound dehydrogenase-like protein
MSTHPTALLPWTWLALAATPALASVQQPAQQPTQQSPTQTASWSTVRLDPAFRAEGCALGDLDRDGELDLVAGPMWWKGPDFRVVNEIRALRAWDPAQYSDSFLYWIDDLDGDGWNDVLEVGFPGEAAQWYRNPGTARRTWQKHLVAEHVDNESPAYADLDGDGQRELVGQNEGHFGWWEPTKGAPTALWRFHQLSPHADRGKFTHGLGVGDVDGDGRADVLEATGWWRQPDSLKGDPFWERHEFTFGGRQGGAQMLVSDVDGDGDADVVTSLAAHGFGLSWFEQQRAEGAITFREHRFVDDTPQKSPHQVRFGEIHALAQVDLDGDGVQDLVTGKRWWSHGAQGDPEPGSPAVLYAFRTTRLKDGGVDLVPTLAHADSGVGVQLAAARRADGTVLVATSNKRGTFVHRLGGAAQASVAGIRPKSRDGSWINLDLEKGDLSSWTATGDAFEGQPIEGDAPAARQREASLHQGRFWIGGYERHGDGRVGTLTSSAFRIDQPWLSFLVGGGAEPDVRVELVACDASGKPTGEVFFKTGGASFESMQRVAVDVTKQVGQLACVRLVDEAKGGWGHINFDDLLLHPSRPDFPRPPGLPEILLRDPQQAGGLAPKDSAGTMSVPPGFEVDLLAAEPDLHQPVAFTFDARGRIWVAEAFTYPQRAPEGEGKDDILVFEDRDADGAYETRTVFASGLNLVSGLEVGFGGAWVGAAPYLYFIPDRNDDLAPDGPPEVLLDGWGYQDTHETLNAFTWGPDGWLYGCHGVFTHSRVGALGTPDDERVPINAGVWRFHPQRKTFEVFAWGTSNPWGLDFDERGQAFITACVIPHLYHAIQGARYIRQAGSHFDEHHYGELDTIADHVHWLGSTPHGGNNRSDTAGGGHAHCGLAIYLGDAFPASYRNALLFGNIHGNRINSDTLERAGSGFVGHHAPDFLLANDGWFRSVAQKIGPDGALYLIDWSDQQACHLTDPQRWDRTNGRLYRVRHGPLRPVKVDLPDLASERLVELQRSPDEWWVRRARVALAERGADREVHAALKSALQGKGTQRERLRSLWALHATGGLDEATALKLLAQESDEDLVAWTVQLALDAPKPAQRVHKALLELAARARSPVVQLYLAAALQRLPEEFRWTVANELARTCTDTSDRNLPWMLWWGIEPLVAAEPARGLALARSAADPKLCESAARRAAAESTGHDALCKAILQEQDGARRAALLTGFELGLRGSIEVAPPPSWNTLWPVLRESAEARERELGLSLAAAFGDPAARPMLRARLADRGAAQEERERALDRLARARDPQGFELIQAALDEPALCAAAIRGLAKYDDPRVAAALTGRWQSLGVEERREALATLAARGAWATALLDAVDSGGVPAGDLRPPVLRTLSALGEPSIVARVEARWGRVRATEGDKPKQIAAWKERLKPARLARADLHRGRSVYDANCAACHKLFGAGGDLGPELTGSNRADLDYLLENTVDPSAVVGEQYLETSVWLADGRILNGVLVRESEGRIVLRSQTETHEIERAQIEAQRLSGLSIMPDGQLEALAEGEVVDLFAYLQGAAQVEPLAASETVAFDGQSLCGWTGDPAVWSVESGEIVGRTRGLEHNSFLVSPFAVRDFRLALDVRLVGDAGNSGIQFRTRALGAGEVAGYQADIGPGWWGKLYEENGRGLLAEGAGESGVKRDGWNRYEITATGSRLRATLNGAISIDLDDPAWARSGLLALQVHSGGPTEVRFKNVELTLDPEALPPLAR